MEDGLKREDKKDGLGCRSSGVSVCVQAFWSMYSGNIAREISIEGDCLDPVIKNDTLFQEVRQSGVCLFDGLEKFLYGRFYHFVIIHWYFSCVVPLTI